MISPGERLTVAVAVHQDLTRAYRLAKMTGLTSLAPKIKGTLKSAEGAVRHANRLRNQEIERGEG